MKALFVVVIGVAAIVLSLRDLYLGFRSGTMRTLAHFSPQVRRSEKPGQFWLLAAINLFVAGAMVLVLIQVGQRSI